MKAIPADVRRVARYWRDFPQIQPGEPRKLSWRQQDLKMECCDCGLIHRMRFNVRGGWLIIRAVRAGKRTPRRGKI